jgi:hypothetical protein
MNGVICSQMNGFSLPISRLFSWFCDSLEGAIKTIIGAKTDLFIFLYMKLLLNSTSPMIQSSIIIVYKYDIIQKFIVQY